MLGLCAWLLLSPASAAQPPQRRDIKILELQSPAFKANGTIPARYSCDGEDVSPELAWSSPPKGTQSFVLIMEDPDAPAGTWTHWVLYDLPGHSKGLEEDQAKKAVLPNGAKQGLAWGVTEFERVGYSGPCPPPGKPHRYFFRLFALDASLGLTTKATKLRVSKSIVGHVLAEGELMGRYSR